MAEEVKTINVCIVTSSGHDNVVMPLNDALKQIEYQINSKKRWLYIDGVHTNMDELSLDKLEAANDIRMMNQMIGGV